LGGDALRQRRAVGVSRRRARRQSLRADAAAGRGIAYLLEQAKEASSEATLAANRAVVRYWVYQAQQGRRVDAALPEVQRAWFRAARGLDGTVPELRRLLAQEARRQARLLGIDPGQAKAALAD
jgi:hypothetical protein